jgi:hypothetical protein
VGKELCIFEEVMSKSKSENTATKYTTSDGYAYLTKRTIVSKAKAAGKRAADEAMQIMGFIVVAEGNWIVKKYEDGRTERLAEVG